MCATPQAKAAARRLTALQITAMRAMYTTAVPVAGIAAAFGCDAALVRHIAQACTPPTVQVAQPGALTTAQRAACMAARRAGVTVAALATLYGVTEQTVARLRRYPGR